MRQLLPEPLEDVDPYDAARPAEPGRSQTRLNFVSSLDGSIVDERGRSGRLGGEGDRAMFRALRAWADAILVAAGTARAEGYGPHRLPAALAARRAADGRPDPAPIVVVTRSLKLDFDSPLFRQARTPTVVLTCAAAPEDARRQAARAGQVVVAGEEEVDLAGGLARLRERGHRSILCEGGPRLAEALFAAGQVDELCLTVAPTLVGRDGPRLVGHLPRRLDLSLDRLFAQGSELYARYRVTGG
jgi:riboflavin-specific deaminase-like protein